MPVVGRGVEVEVLVVELLEDVLLVNERLLTLSVLTVRMKEPQVCKFGGGRESAEVLFDQRFRDPASENWDFPMPKKVRESTSIYRRLSGRSRIEIATKQCSSS